ncbi:MAG: hypothetical protein J6K91_05795 [Opitutales bacterium]|nr:hypothetical protein [Opitutales bacterium]
MAYTVSSTPSASTQTLNNAFKGMMEMPENLREIEKEEYARKLEEQRQARADRYADAQLRLMDAAYQDRIDNRNARAEIVNAFSGANGSSPDVLASNIAPFLAKTGDYGTALQLHNNAHAYSQQQARIADQQAADKATSSWFGAMAGKGTGNTDNAFGRFANSLMSGEWMGQGSRASQPTAQDVGSFIYGSGNASMSPQAKQLAAKQILAYLPNTKTQQPVKFGTHAGQPYAINANGTVNWGSRQPTQTQQKPDEFPKFIKDENGNIYSRELPQTEVWDKEKGRNEIIKGGVNPAYVNAWKRKHGYPVEKEVKQADENFNKQTIGGWRTW